MAQYSGFERKVAFILTKFPGLKAGVKKSYQRLNFLRYKKTYSFKCKYVIKRIGLEDKESYFGYYDKSPINSTNEYVIFQTTNCETTNTPDSNMPVDLVLYDVDNGSYEIIGQSYTYNWQQGTKLMWVDKYTFIYNDFDSEKKQYISKICDVKTKETIVVDYPIYDCFKNEFAISLNFERLDIARADYSYRNLGSKINWKDNSNDGLYYIDLEANSSKLIITIEQIIKFNHKESMDSAKHKFNHVMISPSGKKIMFMHRWFLADGRRFDTLYVCNVDGTDVKVIADDDMVSHCFWSSNEQIFAYLRDNDIGDKYYLIDIYTAGKKEVGKGIIDQFGDGHPSVFKNKILFDSYPDKSRMKRLFIYDIETSHLNELGEFYESFNYYAETRCDLHPRFSFDGGKVFFDSVHEGKRGLYMMDIKQ